MQSQKMGVVVKYRWCYGGMFGSAQQSTIAREVPLRLHESVDVLIGGGVSQD